MTYPEHPRYSRPFTAAEDEIIIDCVNRGATARYCANLLGRSRNSIIGRANRMKLYFPKHEAVKKWPRKYG